MKTLKNSMTNKGKKGFTLTELAIVIAVIAILIAVLVPTFSSVISKARSSNESVACSNEWTNYYIDADIAANGTGYNYLVVYTDNKYTENNTTYYHGYLATAGVYDSTTQLNVTISDINTISYNDDTYNYVGSYEYMADEVSIYSTGSTATLISSVTFSSKSTTYSVSNSGLTITGYGTDYYVTGTYSTSNTTDSSTISALYSSSAPTCIFAIRIYFEGSISSGNVASTTDKTGKSFTTDGDYYADFVMGGNTSTEYYITYTYNNTDVKITIHNNATVPNS